MSGSSTTDHTGFIEALYVMPYMEIRTFNVTKRNDIGSRLHY